VQTAAIAVSDEHVAIVEPIKSGNRRGEVVRGFVATLHAERVVRLSGLELSNEGINSTAPLQVQFALWQQAASQIAEKTRRDCPLFCLT
jgi:hypothetical protein